MSPSATLAFVSDFGKVYCPTCASDLDTEDGPLSPIYSPEEVEPDTTCDLCDKPIQYES